ncbi:uncharacterized protein LOC133288192 [Gastrolobium bilobum]|uniref:uncharacterized protein LOC133288192 n=1 Tax=Gastrolobium bilobum TaxID=150636 RepID=UPI002AB2E232|nr:uncharacterized protein LOC133288192 [Gastrolobium bilobum]
MRIEEYKGSRVDDAHNQEKRANKSKDHVEEGRKGHKPSKYVSRPLGHNTSGRQSHSVLQTEYKEERKSNPRHQQLTSSGKRHRERSNSPKRRRTNQFGYRPRHERDQREDSPRDRRVHASPNNRGRREEDDEDSAIIKHRVINMISDGLSGGGETANARKKHLKQYLAVAGKVISKVKVDSGPTKPKIVWDYSDLGDVLPGHDEPLVIQAIIANFGVNHMFVDHDSSADILFLPCFRALGFTVNDLTPVAGELSGFNATVTKPLGMINLCLSMGTPPTSRSADIQFLVLDTPSAYNAILGRRMFAAFEVSVSTRTWR